MTESTAFHLKYRPTTLDRLIGHEAAVTRLRGLIASGKVPNALAFFGPSSAGKTTMARAFAAAINGVESVSQLRGDYMEINAADQKTIDDVRNLVKVSKFKPTHKYRVIVVDEAQQLLSNQHASQVFLKPLEEPSPQTVWIICSMDPQKFATDKTGKAISNRCTQFLLEPHSDEDLLKQAKRIAKGEGMSKYVKDILDDIVRGSAREMRTLANVMQSIQQYYDGLEDKPKRLTAEAVSSVLRSVDAGDDDAALRVLVGVYANKFDQVILGALDAKDYFQFVQKLLWANSYLMYKGALGTANHSELKHWSPLNRELASRTKKNPVPLPFLAALNVALVDLRVEMGTPGVSAPELIAARLFTAIQKIHGQDQD